MRQCLLPESSSPGKLGFGMQDYTLTHPSCDVGPYILETLEAAIVLRIAPKSSPAGTPRRVFHPQHPACCPRPHESEGRSPKGRSQECHGCVMSALSQVSDLSAQKHGNHADSSESSNCRQQSLAFLTTHLELVNCSTVSLPLVAGSLAAKPLLSAVLCSGYIPLKGLPTSSAAPASTPP